jgi:hypothetical protein
VPSHMSVMQAAGGTGAGPASIARMAGTPSMGAGSAGPGTVVTTMATILATTPIWEALLW